jgi:aspartate aminotransferase
LSQVAASVAFASGAPVAMMADYRTRRDQVVDWFAEVPWVTMPAPDSGPYLWGDVRSLYPAGKAIDTNAFAEALLEQKRVAIMPGEALGVPGFIRLGYIADDVATLRDGVCRLIEFGDAFAAGKT